MHGSSDVDPNPGNLAPRIQAGLHAQIVRHPTAERRWMSHDLLFVNVSTQHPTHGPARCPPI